MITAKTWPIITLVGVSFGYGLLSVGSRWMGQVFGIFTQVYLRIVIALFFMLIFYFRDIRWRRLLALSIRDWLILILMGTAGYGLMIYAIVQGALLTPLLNVSVIFSTVPLFVYLLGITFLRRPISFRILLLLFVSIYGVGVLSSGQFFPTLARFGVGDLWVLISAFFEAIWYLGIRLISNKLNSREITIIAQVVAVLTILPLALVSGESLPTLADFSSFFVVIGLVIGVVMNVFAPLATIYAFKHLDEVFATQLFLSENIFALLVGWFFYGERIGLISLCGAGVVIASVYWMNQTQNQVAS